MDIYRKIKESPVHWAVYNNLLSILERGLVEPTELSEIVDVAKIYAKYGIDHPVPWEGPNTVSKPVDKVEHKDTCTIYAKNRASNENSIDNSECNCDYAGRLFDEQFRKRKNQNVKN